MRAIALTVLLLVISVFAFSQKVKYDLEHRLVLEDSDKYYKFKIYDDTDEVRPKKGLMYTWFSHHKLHHSRGDFEGKLLHGEYIVMTKAHDLVKKGQYVLGLKSGNWKEWHKNGELKSVYAFKDGTLNGSFTEYRADGSVSKKGSYSNGKLEGKIVFLDSEGNETTKNYKAGEEVLKEEPKEKKPKSKKPKKKPAKSEDKKS